MGWGVVVKISLVAGFAGLALHFNDGEANQKMTFLRV
jgi:hypothetical protein